MRGDRLKDLRIKHNYTQQELAEFLQTSSSQVKRWENDEVIPSSDALSKMATVFGVTSDYLLGLVDEPESKLSSTDLSANELRIVELVRAGRFTDVMRILLDAQKEIEK